MKKKLCITILLITTLFCGCQQNKFENHRNGSLNEHSTLKKYLLDLPAVKSVNTWQSTFGQGLQINTKHYKIYTTLEEPLMLRQVPGFIEAAYQSYQKQLPKPIETDQPFTIYLFATRDQWETFTKDFAKPNADIYLKIQRGAYYLNGSCVAYNIGRTQTFSVIGHEAWHQFASRHFKFRLPSWLDEGIAMHFETTEYKQGRFDFVPHKNLQRLGALKLALMKNKMMPVEKLITLNPGQVITHGSSEDTLGFYAQSYALVRFLRESHYGKRLYHYNKMLTGSIKGTWPLDSAAATIATNRNIPLTTDYNSKVATLIFKKYIGDDFQTIEKEYINFCDKITRRIVLGTN